MDPYNQPTAPPVLDLQPPPYYQAPAVPPSFQQHQPFQQSYEHQQQQPFYPQQQHEFVQQKPVVLIDQLPPEQPASQQASLEPASLQPAPLQPISLQPISLQPISLQPISLQPIPLQPAQQIVIQQQQPMATVVTLPQPKMVVASPYTWGYRGCELNVKIIAWLDIIDSALACLVLVLIFASIVKAIHYYNDHYARTMIAFSIIGLIIYVIELVIACQLLSATEPNMPATIAIMKARRWRNYNIFLLVVNVTTACLGIIGMGFLGLFSFLFLLVRVFCVYVVHRFIQNLEYSSCVAVVGMTTTTAYVV